MIEFLEKLISKLKGREYLIVLKDEWDWKVEVVNNSKFKLNRSRETNSELVKQLNESNRSSEATKDILSKANYEVAKFRSTNIELVKKLNESTLTHEKTKDILSQANNEVAKYRSDCEVLLEKLDAKNLRVKDLEARVKELTPVRKETKYEPPVEKFTPVEVSEDYYKLLETVKIDPLWSPIFEAVEIDKQKFIDVSRKTNVPWQVIAFISFREAGLTKINGERRFKFDRQLLNGERWDRVTTLVPKNLGPWNSWIESAIFAMERKKRPAYWNVANTLYFLECYNGLGYRKYHSEVNSPYLWGKTSHYTKGGYESDGKWKDNYVNKQTGAVAFLVATGFIESGYLTKSLD